MQAGPARGGGHRGGVAPTLTSASVGKLWHTQSPLTPASASRETLSPPPVNEDRQEGTQAQGGRHTQGPSASVAEPGSASARACSSPSVHLSFPQPGPGRRLTCRGLGGRSRPAPRFRFTDFPHLSRGFSRVHKGPNDTASASRPPPGPGSRQRGASPAASPPAIPFSISSHNVCF